MDKDLPITLLFPFPPSVNTLYFQGPKHGQKFLSKKGKEYKQRLHYLHADEERVPLEGRIAVSVVFIPPDKRERDVDNYLKAVLDGLTDLNYVKDDSQIFYLEAYKVDKMENYNKGAVIVSINHCMQNLVVNLDLEQFLDQYGLDANDRLMFHKPVKKYIKKADRIKG